ncbi:MAG: LysR family transcriptional regulator [Betaproteobacteria bacterium]|nr:LysR family transcriptional regulator [Betaproteobacteria bacterium]
MDIRQLRYFVAVAEELNFSQAARRLHMSQPPLSQQIKAVEDELGTVLLERNRRRVRLTEPGRLFLVQARSILAQLDGAGDEVRRAARGEAGEIRVAFTGSVPMFEPFPRFIQAFREKFPGVRVEMGHMSSGAQLQAIADRRIDVGFLRPSHQFAPGPDIEVRTIWEDELMAVLPSAHRLARARGGVRVADLADEPFILFPRGIGCGLYDHVMGLCSQAGFAPRLAQEAREGVTILALIAAGTGISILPDTYRNANIPGVVHRPLATRESKSRLLLAWRASDKTPLLGRFLAMADAWPGFASASRTATPRRKKPVAA